MHGFYTELQQPRKDSPEKIAALPWIAASGCLCAADAAERAHGLCGPHGSRVRLARALGMVFRYLLRLRWGALRGVPDRRKQRRSLGRNHLDQNRHLPLWLYAGGRIHRPLSARYDSSGGRCGADRRLDQLHASRKQRSANSGKPDRSSADLYRFQYHGSRRNSQFTHCGRTDIHRIVCKYQFSERWDASRDSG